MIVVVTASRDLQDPRPVWQRLDELVVETHLANQFLDIGVGDCPTGGDLYTRQWCEAMDIRPRVFYADWARHRRAAGPKRNRLMIDRMRPHRVLAFPRPESKGTMDCGQYAESLGIPVEWIWENTPLPPGYKWNDTRGLQ